jgi:Kef-type K+ transport system membrane component KefB
MSKYRNSLFYFGTVAGFSYLIYYIIGEGKLLESGKTIQPPATVRDQWTNLLESLKHNLQEPLSILLLQIITIILVARIFGWMFRKIGQPSVIGEMVAGIVIGPSLAGYYFPEFFEALFPAISLGNLKFLSQIGLILFMFVIGMELDLKSLKNKANDAIVISHASIVIPFTLGTALAYFIYGQFAPRGIEFISFALFLGISMSITAFPVLARIVQERGIHKTRLGTIVITCAAADDITAWCILAAVIAIVKAGSFLSSLYVIALSIAYVFLMLKLVRPFLERIGQVKNSRHSLSKPVVAIFFLTLIISSFCTEVIGIHALFGAFMAGAIMPDSARFRSLIIEKVEDVSVILLLPLFFVFTGLRTEVGLISDPYLLKITALIIVVGVAGKFFGSALAAKFVGQNWRDSLAIGALMNTRGLMELIVLNIGLDLGVLSPEIFTMMVIMALVTTFMTGPALDLIDHVFTTTDEIIPSQTKSAGSFKILISFNNPVRGITLLRLANSLVKTKSPGSQVTAMHLRLSNAMHTFDIEQHEQKIFEPITAEAGVLDMEVRTLFKVSNDIDSDIVEIANKGEHDLLLIGFGKSIFEGTVLGKVLGYTTSMLNPERLIDKFTGKEGLFENSPFDERTRQIVNNSRVPVGILIDKDLKELQRVFLPLFGAGDSFLLDYAGMMISTNGSSVSIVDPYHMIDNDRGIAKTLDNMHSQVPDKIKVVTEMSINKEFLKGQDIMLISLESWKKLVNSQSTWLSNTPSVLIIKP